MGNNEKDVDWGKWFVIVGGPTGMFTLTALARGIAFVAAGGFESESALDEFSGLLASLACLLPLIPTTAFVGYKYFRSRR